MAVESDVIDDDDDADADVNDDDDTDNVIVCGSSNEIKHIDISMICRFCRNKRTREKRRVTNVQDENRKRKKLKIKSNA